MFKVNITADGTYNIVEGVDSHDPQNHVSSSGQTTIYLGGTWDGAKLSIVGRAFGQTVVLGVLKDYDSDGVVLLTIGIGVEVGVVVTNSGSNTDLLVASAPLHKA